MPLINLILPLLVLFSLALQGCEQSSSDMATKPDAYLTKHADQALQTAPVATAPVSTHTIFRDPVEPAMYESTSGALATWRTFAEQKPILILYSKHPLLDPLLENERANVQELLRNDSAEEIIRRGRWQAADTAFLQAETVSAAIEGGLISELVFVLPTSRELAEFSLKDFRNKALASASLTEEEAIALTLQEGVIRGTVRGIPFRCVHPQALPDITGPVLVHIDLSYFANLYDNDIHTPVYDLIHQSATDLRDKSFPVLAVSLSYSNQEIGFSLDSRFVISDLAEILRHPDWLTDGTPASWSYRSGALFASTMFSESRSRELTAQAALLNPDDPAALYHQAINLFQEKQVGEAFAMLDNAVALDPGYALAYRELAETALEKGRAAEAIDLLNKSAKSFPDNPWIKIRLAEVLILTQKSTGAIPLIDDLKNLPWSSSYHAGVPGHLEKLTELAVQRVPSKSP